MDKKQLLDAVMLIASEAGEAILQAYNDFDSVQVEKKADKTPLTNADLASHKIIVEGLTKLTPEWPVLSEESQEVPFDERKHWDKYWLVDPLDGTKEFLDQTDEFSVNIALIENHKPILGVIYVPVTRVCYFASNHVGAGVKKGDKVRSISTVPANPEDVTLVVSRRHNPKRLEHLLQELNGAQVKFSGSAIKFGLIAEAQADVYLRLGETSEWDTAAGQCIVEEAGGRVIDLSGQPLRYNTEPSLTNEPFLVVGDPEYTEACLKKIERHKES